MQSISGTLNGRRIVTGTLALAVLVATGAYFVSQRAQVISSQICIDGKNPAGKNCVGNEDPICDPRFCGNDMDDPGEQCDDGNNAVGDGCDPLCRLECQDDADCPSGQCAGGICVDLCGNGVIEPAVCTSEGGGLDCPPPEPGDMKVVNLPGGVLPLTHAMGDLNSDGMLDIVVSNYMGASGGYRGGGYAATIEAFLNLGGGNFGPRTQIGTYNWQDGGGTRALDVFDVDTDGDADVVFYDSTSATNAGLFVLRNDNMVFTRTGPVLRHFAFHVTHGDATSDGDPDIGISGWPWMTSGSYGAFFSKGGNGSSFNTSIRLDSSNGHAAPQFGDMDGDGDKDFVNIGYNNGYAINVHLSNGDGTFGPIVVMYSRNTNPNAHTLVLADMNNDGNLDVLIGENGRDAVVVLGDGRGGSLSSEVLTFDVQPRVLAVADPTADGIPDIIFGAGAGSEGQNLWYAEGNGDGTFKTPFRFVTLSPPADGPGPPPYSNADFRTYDLRSADYDGDGRMDLSVTHGSYSNSTSVIFFRSSIDGCTDIPPDIVCSQTEQCDDGSDNGEPGMCTRQCVLCGNGVIDTVDGVPEQCDDGPNNGEEGSECLLRCMSVPLCGNGRIDSVIGFSPWQNPTNRFDVNNNGFVQQSDLASVQSAIDNHTPAIGALPDPPDVPFPYIDVNGDGSLTDDDREELQAYFTLLLTGDPIPPELDPAPTPSMLAPEPCDEGDRNGVDGSGCSAQCTIEDLSRLGCIGVGQCIPVPGDSAAPECANNDDCCDPADPLCKHMRCNDDTFQCQALDGPGLTNCASDPDCTQCGNGKIEIGETCDEGANNRSVDEDGLPTSLRDWWCKDPSCAMSSCFDGADNDHDSFGDEMDPGCWSYNISGFGLRPKRGFWASLLAQARVFTPVQPEEFLPGKDDEMCPVGMADIGSFCGLLCEPGDICPTGDACPANGVCPPVCGNNIIDLDLGEECDDGNLNDDDACQNNCRLPSCVGSDCPRCGDGIFHPDLGEQCDGSDPPPAAVEQGCTMNCRLRCTDDDDCPGTCDEEVGLCVPPACGDGDVNQVWERCDDGNINNVDACSNACQPTCREDSDCESGRCDKAIQICHLLCGNGNVDPDEMCDDGNIVDNDACTNQCLLHCTDDSTCDCDEEKGVCRTLCGNGRLDPGEDCDDGNGIDRDECSNRCRVRCRLGTMCPDAHVCPQNGQCPPPRFCGDGVVDGASEQCDDGNNIETDGCNTSCRLRCSQNLECPNGLLCVGEECTECTNSLQCDNGFCVNGRCSQALPICGNGQVDPGEVCDDSNGDDTDGCTSNCLFPINHACVASAQCQTRLCESNVCTPCTNASQCASGLRCVEGNCLFGGLQCGDATVQAGEACDDGNLSDRDGCTSACLLPFGESCDHALQCVSTICSGGECSPCRSDAECASGTRCAIGVCLTDAHIALIPNVCGNGLSEEGEECDDGNNAYGDGCTPGCYVGNAPSRVEVAANMTIHMPFRQEVDGPDDRLRPGAIDDLTDTGPATVAIMAVGAAAGTAWVRRRWRKKR